jgi:hypothetical protein
MVNRSLTLAPGAVEGELAPTSIWRDSTPGCNGCQPVSAGSGVGVGRGVGEGMGVGVGEGVGVGGGEKRVQPNARNRIG